MGVKAFAPIANFDYENDVADLYELTVFRTEEKEPKVFFLKYDEYKRITTPHKVELPLRFTDKQGIEHIFNDTDWKDISFLAYKEIVQ